MNRIKNLMKEEKGIAFPLFVVFLSTFILVFSFVTDLGQTMIFRHEAQGIADSMSLAGVSATKTIPVYEYDPDTGNSVVTGFDLILDEILAKREAKSAWNKHWSIIYDMSLKGKHLNSWKAEIIDSTEFEVTIFGEIETPLRAGIMNLLGNTGPGHESVELRVKAKTKLIPD